jgi:diacylglycerol kinase family enzyme
MPRKPDYTAIAIIFNPISTGPSKQYALALRSDLRRELPEMKQRINCVLTEYAGHAEELAYDLAKATERPLIIASGGDGSYHEVVNGAMRAQSEGATPTCGLLPGGNANDHHTALHDQPIEDMILHGRRHVIDLLLVDTKGPDGKLWQRYAHSYAGFGLTAEAGRELNKHKLNRIREAWIVLKTLKNLRARRVLVNGRRRAYTSLVCSNIHRMSKVLKLSDQAKVHDGKFEITAVRGPNKRRLVMQLIRASTRGFDEVEQTEQFRFTTIKPMRFQIDGEIYRIAGDTVVTISIAPRVLRCVV